MTRAPRAAATDPKAAPETPAGTAVHRSSVSTKRTPELEAVIGARVRVARIAARMSQGDLGAAVGITFQQVQKYERGKDRVAASTLQGFAAALGMHPGSFYGDDMPVPSGNIPEVRAAMRIAQRIQRVRDPVVVKRLMALIDLLAGSDDDGAERSTSDDDTSL